jgi:hypothetical protein
MEIFDKIPVSLEPERVLQVMRVRNKNRYMEELVGELVELARPIARPKAVHKISYINGKNGDTVIIDDIMFTSRVLRKNLDNVERVFPYVATCGTELDEIELPPDDYMKVFCLDAIKTTVLGMAITYLRDYMTRYYALGTISHMNPGSLKSWPVSQQRELFSLFGNVEALIGVKLTEGCVMSPLKSVSGIYFPTETRFESCQLCPREKCIGRRAPYNPEFARKYREDVQDNLIPQKE